MTDTTQPISEGVRCGYCQKPAGAEVYRWLGKFCCSNCANQVRPLIVRSKFELSRFITGVGAGLGTAIGCAIVWAVIAHATKSQWGIVAALFGFAIGRVIFKMSGGIRGIQAQVATAILAVLAVLAGKLIALAWFIKDRAEIGWAESFFKISTLIRSKPEVFFEAWDLIWVAIAIYGGWRICRAVPLDLTGPLDPASLPQQSIQFQTAQNPTTAPPQFKQP